MHRDCIETTIAASAFPFFGTLFALRLFAAGMAAALTAKEGRDKGHWQWRKASASDVGEGLRWLSIGGAGKLLKPRAIGGRVNTRSPGHWWPRQGQAAAIGAGRGETWE